MSDTPVQTPMPSREEIVSALHHLIDPEVGINVVDLGMIGAVDIGDDGRVVIEMIPTTAGCPMHDTLSDGAKFLAGGLRGVTAVDVRFTYEPPWTPERITPEGREALGMM
jgi:metal-sulfur cluster biosynthetic enzyme